MMSVCGKEGRYKAKQSTMRRRNCKKKQKKNYCPQQDCKLSVLPDEIVMNCLAYVSRLDHGSLYLVSKLHRSVMLSPELYQARSLLGCTEHCIYLCLRAAPDPFVRWYAFYPKAINHPSRLVPIRPHLYQPPAASSVVAHGWGIYVIGGMIGGKQSSKVFFLDCRFHTWTNLPSMMLARACAAAGVVDGKIYVVGGVEESNPLKWVVEVFDPKRQTWSTLSNQPQPPPPPSQDDLYTPSLMPESGVIEVGKTKKIFGLNENGISWLYVPSQRIWKTGNSDTNKLRKGWHVIDNVVYSCVTGGWILWCEASELESEAGEMEWRQVMGLEDLRVALCASRVVNFSRGFMPSEYLDDMLPGYKLSNSGPNMLLFWDCLANRKWEIWCAEISLQRRKETGEIWGTVEWSEAVTRIDRPLDQHPYHCKIIYSQSFNL